VNVNWAAATSSCPLTPTIRYNVFRGTVPDFVPSVANRIATCVVGPSSYVDTADLSSGTTYYYVVRAEDVSTGNGGECGGGNEEANDVVIPGTPYRAGTQAGPGIWTDGAGDVTSTLRLNIAGPGDTADRPWRYVRTADDPGANHTPGGAYAYRNAGPGPSSTYGANVCAEIQAPPLKVDSPSVDLQYWERHQIEYHWDAVAVEYSVQGGDWTDVPPPSNSAADGCDPGDTTTGWEPLSCTMDPPINGCGYPASKSAFNGPLASGTSCDNWVTSASVPPYAHRCHRVNGLTPGTTIQFRWRFSSDPGAEFAGFYLDDLAVTNVRLPRTCTPDTCAGELDGVSCDDGDACTAGDSCSGGICQPGAMQCPAEVNGLLVNGHSNTTLTWNALPGGVVYDVVSSTLSDLRQNDTATASCLANDVSGASTVDGRPNPAQGDGYYYLIRAQSPGRSGTFGADSSGAQRLPFPGCS
jgi:hypothetical protein